MDDRRDLGVVAHRQRILADDVDVALVELAEAPFLRALAAVHALDLVAAERKRQLVLVLGHITGQGHGQVKAQRQFGRAALLQRAGRLHEIDLALGLAAGLGQQHLGKFEYRGFDRLEAETAVIAADDLEHVVEGALFAGQQFQGAGRGTGLDHGCLQSSKPPF